MGVRIGRIGLERFRISACHFFNGVVIELFGFDASRFLKSYWSAALCDLPLSPPISGKDRIFQSDFGQCSVYFKDFYFGTVQSCTLFNLISFLAAEVESLGMPLRVASAFCFRACRRMVSSLELRWCKILKILEHRHYKKKKKPL